MRAEDAAAEIRITTTTPDADLGAARHTQRRGHCGRIDEYAIATRGTALAQVRGARSRVFVRSVRFIVVSSSIRTLGVALLFASVGACGGTVVREVGGDAGGEPDPGHEDAGASIPPSPTPLTPTYDAGGMALSCAPNDGDPTSASAPFPGCTFVDSQACQSDAQCGCGCSCECGVCNCNAAGLVAECAPSNNTGEACCANDDDCGPSCYGLSCQGGRCISTTVNDWIGIWSGSFTWPSTAYEGNCSTGVGASSATGVASGPMTIQVIGTGNQVTFLLTSQEEQGLPLCALPFIVTGDTATMVPGATCVIPGGGDLCSNGPPHIWIQTFTQGAATIANGTMSFQSNDVFVETVVQGPECDAPPEGANQVNIESLSATLQRATH
jgi:hypothetical protein